MRTRSSWLTRMLLTVVGAAAALAVAGGSAVDSADAASNAVGAVYVQSNSVPNVVRVLYRSASGELTRGPDVPTGGAGTTSNPPFGLAVNDSQGSVVLTQDNRVLLVTNNGSDTISSFRVLPDGNIVLADQEWSRGDFPNSIGVTNTGANRSLAYVLNENSETVSGFTVGRDGSLTAIPGSTRSVSGLLSAQVGFNADGRVLTVTNRNNVFVGLPPNGSISTFPVDPSSGLLGAEVVTPATGTGTPFGFEYTKRDHLIVANAGQFPTFVGSASSYELDKRSATPAPRDVAPAGGITCWVAVTNNNAFAYVTDSGSLTVSGYRITADGELVPIGVAFTPGAPLDIDTSVNSRYAYVLNTDLDFSTFVFGDSRVTAFAIDGGTGDLTLIGSTPAGMGGNSGLASF